jgi:hypothetical protein
MTANNVHNHNVTKQTVNNVEKHNMPLKYIATIPVDSFRPKYHAIIFTNICYINCNLNIIEVSTF